MTETIAISVQAQPEDAAGWLALARELDDAGFATLYAADHPGSGAAPFVALAAAASVTERIALGTCVVNAGLWEPIALAAEVATLDVVSGGRALLGLGAGHTPAEWEAVGRTIPAPGARVDRLEQVVAVVRQLLAGEEVTVAGPHVHATDARLTDPRPVQPRVPLMVGGAGRRVLALGAREADVVGVTGMGRTLADGHRHAVDWSEADLEASFGALHAATAAAGTRPGIEALVQHVEVADDREAAAARLAERLGDVEPADLLAVPYVWIGTVEQIAEQLHHHRRRWGVDRYVVRPAAVGVATDVLRAL
jgi:probable F420-dependent oxidoreductase